MIEYRFRVPSAAVFTLYSYSKALEYRFRVSTAGSLIPKLWRQQQGGGDSLQNLARNLGTLGSSLSAWDQSTFGSVHKKLSQLRKELEWVRGQNIGTGPTRAERRLMKEISKLLSREEMMERHRSRVEWLREGDRNTSFFQAKSKERAKTNRITALHHTDGSVASEQQELVTVATSEGFLLGVIHKAGEQLSGAVAWSRHRLEALAGAVAWSRSRRRRLEPLAGVRKAVSMEGGVTAGGRT
jgi:hypothetical protein